ncbi:hypothetical protein AURDEDRAFT_82199 [Auricularia subglabra TFB-10046 SS5]|nr:hypothetical protein AURDEDRAFT_82199 [Auricularia subglabra TFB-10046 SS5]
MFDDGSLSPPPAAAPKPKGKRAMDTYLEKIKRDQAEREARLKRHSEVQGKSVSSLAAMEVQSGSRDRGDPETSNLFVANLPVHITEATFGNFFSRHGPVGSVKIMWPRSDGGQGPGADITSARRTGLSGFVSFMKRKDAEDALRELDGFDWGGSVLRVGWSKAVPIAAKAAYDARGGTQGLGAPTISHPLLHSHSHGHDRRERSRSRSRERDHSRRHHSRPSHSHSDSRSRSRSRTRHRSRSRSPRRRSRSRSRSPRRRSRSHSRSRRHRSRSHSRSRRRSWRDRSPSPRPVEADAETESFMRMVVGMIKDHGQQFEAALREREAGKPQFAFLWDEMSPLYRMFRRLLESDQQAHEAFNDDGSHSVYSTDSQEESEREHGGHRGRLGPLARKRFEVMLRALTGNRGEIGRCMVFSLDHAEAAAEIADIIVSALLVDSTAVPRKVARLFLICDILHNSAAAVPFAWKYRQEFQARLGLVFDHLSTIYHSFPGRITAETFKKQITTVVDIWEDWIVFPPDFTAELRARLDGAPTVEESKESVPVEEAVEETTPEAAPVVSKFKASAFKPAAAASEGADVDGEQLDDVDGDPMNDDIDGEPLAGGEDLDGAPLDEDLDGAPLADDDVDGAPLAEEDADGAPLVDDDLDGAPMAEDDLDSQHLASQVDNSAAKPVNDAPAPDKVNDSDAESAMDMSD